MSDQLNPSTYPQQLMTTKLKQSERDNSSHISELLIEANDLAHGIEVLNEGYELSPLRQQALTEAVSLIDRVVSTLEAVR